MCEEIFCAILFYLIVTSVLIHWIFKLFSYVSSSALTVP